MSLTLTRSRRLRSLVAGLAVAALACVSFSLTSAAPAQATTTCNSAYVATQGKYWLNNNLWGASSGTGWQCSWDSYTSGNTIGWGTSWSWSGGQYSVKSYASSVLGWQWGNRLSGTGLPVRIWDNKSVNTGWNFSVSGSNVMNVSYDLWFSTSSNPGSANPTDELMVWPYRSGGAGPLGTKQTTVYYAGANWDLYKGQGSGWPVYSFVRQSTTTSVTLNLRDFINDVVYNRGWMSNGKYLVGVQAGTEIFTGTGQLNVNSYYANVG
jgi:Glycosyl hydrolase family 12